MKLNRFTNIGLSLVLSVGTLVPVVASAANLSSFIQLTGSTTSDNTGRSMATGDVNGDGYDDLVIGAHHQSGDATGKVYLIYGQSSPLTSATLSTSNVTFTGASTGDQAGVAVAVGDLNADGYDDIVIGANKDDDTLTNAGAIYIIYGQVATLTSQTLSASVGAKFTGEAAGDIAGTAVAVADINGDTFADILVGSPKNNDGGSDAGAVYMIPGAATQYTGVTGPLGSNREYTGEVAGDELGGSVTAGDIDGNGTADMIFGAPFNDDSGADAGAVYLVYTTVSTLTASTVSASTAAEFTGEAAGDNAGSAVASGDINGDGYDEILIGAPSNDSTASGAGSVHVIAGNANQYTGTASVSTTQLVEYDGEETTDQAGVSVAVQDLNNDGYAELLIGANNASATAGATYIIAGAALLTGGNVGTVAAVEYDGANTTDAYGRWITTGDLNGDGFADFIASATTYLSGGGTGAVYIGYLSIDADEDGVLGTSGIYYTGTDCNDADATVSADQTYYADTDADALGDPAVTTTSCTSTAPTGYVADSTDTNDTIPNNGVEIDGDAIDNDGDGEIDEVNTGEHPYYSTLDAATSTTVNTDITAVTGTTNGNILVTYADNSIYQYAIFEVTSTKTTKVEQYVDTGYAVVVHPKGKKLKLVNIYSGAVADTLKLTKKNQTSQKLLLTDFRSDDATEAAIITQLNKKVTVSVVKVSVSNENLSKHDKLVVTDAKNIKVSKTKNTTKKINLKNKKGKVLFTLLVSKQYALL